MSRCRLCVIFNFYDIMKKIDFITHGTCSRLIRLTLTDDDIVDDVEFIGGCNGNLQGICSLVRGQKAAELIARLKGIRCGGKDTSCPDQLAEALAEACATKTEG